MLSFEDVQTALGGPVSVKGLGIVDRKHIRYTIVVQLLNPVQLSATPWTVARQATLSFTISWRLLKVMSIESVMPSNHLVLCHPLPLLSSVFPSIRYMAFPSISDPKTVDQVCSYAVGV